MFVFYDKGVEAKSKGVEIPMELEDANLLRYEIRFDGRLPQQLKWPMVIASTLYEREFYKMMVKRYKDIYFSIPKIKQVKTDIMSEIKTVGDAFNVFVARLISQTGQDQIGGFLNELKEAGVFAERTITAD